MGVVANLTVGPYRIELGDTLSVTDTRTSTLVWSTLTDSFVSTAISHDKFKGAAGCWMIERNDRKSCKSRGVSSARVLPNSSALLSGDFDSLCSAFGWTLLFSLPDLDASALSFSLTLNGSYASYDRLSLTYARHNKERFFGFGQQYTYLDGAGSLIPIFTREGGVGRGLQPITAALNALGREAGGDTRTTYSASPIYITSALRSLHLTSTEPCEFDMRTARAVRLEVSAVSLHGRMLGASSPLNLLQRVTAFTGRMGPLPPWSHSGVIVGIQGGSGRVANLTARLLQANVRLAGVWLQDWGGVETQTILGMPQNRLKWDWRLDKTLYPHWEGKLGLVANLSRSGVRVLTYLNTFLSDNSSDPQSRYAAAKAEGALLTGPSGDPVDVNSGQGPHLPRAGLIDLSGEVGASLATKLVKEMMALGTSGWMADFGEYLPFDSQPASGRGAMAEHNAYPGRWQVTNARAVAAASHAEGQKSEGGETPVWFARSSGLTSPAVTPLFWLGDQLPSWDKNDGLASVVVGMLSSGMSGHALTHSDVGGYTTIRLPQLGIHYTRKLELLQRWAELSIFTAFWRSHEGSVPSENVQPYDEEALPHIARCSILFASLAPYRTRLMNEARDHGWPLVRPTWLHYPQDPNTLDLDAQFLEGPDLLVAPVLHPSTTTVQAYLPPDTWLHPFANLTIRSTGQTLSLPAPIGRPAALIRLNPVTGLPPPELQPFLTAVRGLEDV